MNSRLALAATLACLAFFGLRARAEDPAPPTLAVELADGTILVGTLDRASEIRLAQPGGEKKFAAGAIDRIAVSSMREVEAKKLEETVESFRAKLGAEDVEEREAAMAAMKKLPGASALFVKKLLGDPDPEIVVRARTVLGWFEERGDRQDPRDMVVVGEGAERGWLTFDTLDLQTALGRFAINRAEIRTLRRAELPEDAPRKAGDEPWAPPLADLPLPEAAKDRLPIVVALRGGWRLVGDVARDALPLVNEDGVAVPSNRLVSLLRVPNSPGRFRVRRRGAPDFQAKLDVRELAIVAGARRWSVDTELLETIEVGPYLRGQGLAQLVQRFQRAVAQGEKPPAQRFWVHIKGQPANPWDSENQLGMTWSLLSVKGEVCLVGADEKTNAYTGDMPTKEELPILCIKRSNLAVPEGVDPGDFYNGWSGGEIRLTRPMAGTLLSSLEEANKLVASEFGEEWRIAEFHDTSNGGWHWWAYWGKVPPQEK